MADTTATTDITPVESTPAEPAEAEPTKVESPKTEPAKAESSSKRESKSHRREKSPATETPEEKHARREERARRREARENRKAAEAAAMGLGIRKKDKQRRHSSEKSRAPAAHGGEASTSLSRSKSTGAKAASAAASSDAQVRDTSAARSEKRRTRLITYKDSATAGPQVARSEHRHHHHHDHSTPEAQAECRRCLKKQKKREKQAQEKPEAEAEAEAEDGPVPAGEEAAVVEGAEPAKPAEAPREKEEEFSPQPPTRRSSARAEASSAPQRKMSVRRRIEMPPPPGLPPERRSSKHGEKKDKEKGKGKGRPLLEFVIAKKHEKLVTCVTCLQDDVPQKEAARLGCNHWFCHDCLKRIFTLSLTDPAHMPPRCCSDEHIPLKYVDKLLSYQTKKQWNKKYLEYTTANRIYCPTTDCGEWIRPHEIHNNVGRCSRCKTKVCARCNGKAHGDDECPKDEDFQKFVETAQKNKYQRCHNCRAMVELDKGCNHMTCRCTAEFCYVCGAKWKTCSCPWFNYTPEEADGQGDLRAEQLREDEELARRLARELNPLAANHPQYLAGHGPFADEFAGLPAINPFAALGNIGLGLRTGIRRLAADYVEATRVGGPGGEGYRQPQRAQQPPPSPPQQPPRRPERRATAPTGQRQQQQQEQPTRSPRSPRRQPVHVPAPRGATAPPPPPPPPPTLQNPYLTNAAQATIERFLRQLDIEDPEPAVEAPFGGGIGLRRSQTEPRVPSSPHSPRDRASRREREHREPRTYAGDQAAAQAEAHASQDHFQSQWARFSPYVASGSVAGVRGRAGSLAELGWGWVSGQAGVRGGRR